MKRILSLILCFVLLTALLPVSVTGHGSVTEVVPEGYIPIYTPEELSAIREDLTANYILMADIDLTEALAEGGSLYNPSRGWESIGDGNHPDSMGYPFTGIFDGNGHRIRGIYGKGYASGLFCNN